MVGIEDLEPELASELTDVINIAKNMRDEMERVQKYNEKLREQIVGYARDEVGKLRGEVR